MSQAPTREESSRWRAGKSVSIASTLTLDAVAAVTDAGIRDGQLLLVRTASILLIMAEDHQGTQDFTPETMLAFLREHLNP